MFQRFFSSFSSNGRGNFPTKITSSYSLLPYSRKTHSNGGGNNFLRSSSSSYDIQPSSGEEGIIKSPLELYNYLNEYVVEQHQAKKILSVAVYNHYCRFKHNRYNFLSKDRITLEKSNIMLIGPSGSGKTLLAKTITSFLNVPFTICDATTLTQAGYVGEDVESILYRLLQNADFDVQKAQRGIVFIDEVDKIAKKKGSVFSNGRDVAGEGVQQALLKLLEGSLVDVPNKSSRKILKGESICLDTSNILFILSGAFIDLQNIVSERLASQSAQLGFGSSVERPSTPPPKTTEEQQKDFLTKTENVDLIEYGLIPEFLGRAPILAILEELSEEALVAAMTETKNCILKQYQMLFKINGIDLKFTQDAILEIARLAKSKKIGARGLRSIYESILLPAMFEAPGTNVKKVIIDEAVAKGMKKPIMLTKK